MERTMLFLAITLFSTYHCFGQRSFESEIIAKFPLIKLPVDSIQNYKVGDTLNKTAFNQYLKNRIAKKPIYVVNGKKEFEFDYFGLLSTVGDRVIQFDKDNKRLPDLIHHDRAYMVGLINLSKNFFNPIVKVVALRSTYYDLYSFDKEGKLLSIVPLYYYENIKVMDERPGVVHVKSTITKDGKIIWFEKYPDRIREREYILNVEGFFEVVSQKIQDKN